MPRTIHYSLFPLLCLWCEVPNHITVTIDWQRLRPLLYPTRANSSSYTQERWKPFLPTSGTTDTWWRMENTNTNAHYSRKIHKVQHCATTAHRQSHQEQDPSWEETLTGGLSKATTSSEFTRDYDEQSLHQRTHNVQYLQINLMIGDRLQSEDLHKRTLSTLTTENYPSVEPKLHRELIPGEHWEG